MNYHSNKFLHPLILSSPLSDDALERHRIFQHFLSGVCGDMTTTQEHATSEVQLPPGIYGLGPTIIEAPVVRILDVPGQRVVVSSVTTVTPTALKTVTTTSRTHNAVLPTLAGLEGVLMKIAAFSGVVVGEELRHTRGIGPGFAAINWYEHDAVFI